MPEAPAEMVTLERLWQSRNALASTLRIVEGRVREGIWVQ